eukprot:GFUD01027716.1.p1 GENE.GFUD01027716.1~~GFUD01027716.1.p1  ORF type:complete len:809 (-),score=108.64 GFUD01027716.1:36-2462(-)
MKQFAELVLLAMWLTSAMGGVVKRSTNEERQAGLNFFDQFQSMFGWGSEPATSPPPPFTPRPPPLFHTATVAPYGHQQQPHLHPGHQRPHSHPGDHRPHSHPGHQQPHSHPGHQQPHAHPGHQQPHAHPGHQQPHAHPGHQQPHAHPGHQQPHAHPGHQQPHAHPGHQQPHAQPGRQQPRPHPGHQQPHPTPGGEHASLSTLLAEEEGSGPHTEAPETGTEVPGQASYPNPSYRYPQPQYQYYRPQPPQSYFPPSFYPRPQPGYQQPLPTPGGGQASPSTLLGEEEGSGPHTEAPLETGRSPDVLLPTGPGQDPPLETGHSPDSLPPPVPGQDPPLPTTAGSEVPGQASSTKPSNLHPQPQYQAYPPQPYYSPSFYPQSQYPYYQSPYYSPQVPVPWYNQPRASGLNLDDDYLSSRTLPEDEEEGLLESHHKPNKHKAVPNKASNMEPDRSLPFLMTKSQLPISILPPEDCHSEAGLLGECLSASDCGSTSGQPSGLCHMGRDVSLHARVCCTYPGHCGFETNHRVTYLKSPNYPEQISMLSHCPYTVNLLPGVCQVRLDFMDFHMKPLNHGICNPSNSMTIKSSHKSTTFPTTNLCGTIATGEDDPLRTDVPHLYAHFDMDPVLLRDDSEIPNKKDTPPSLQLNFNVTSYPSKWNIRVSQIVCDGANLQAPNGCSQYYNSNSGNITSLNLPDRQYMTDASIDACIARDPTACAIKYRFKTMGVGPTKGGGLGYGLVCTDYIKFRGEKTGLCGKGEGREMILPSKGPMGFSFRSDSSHIPEADVGYRVEYAYQHDCSDLQFFKYPVTK